MGRFQVSNQMNMNCGKVIVDTDENGVPNQRPGGFLGSFLGLVAQKSSYVPLHIPRWDNKSFNQPKEDLIKYVETKFVYPEETKDLTQDWMLKVVNERWEGLQVLPKEQKTYQRNFEPAKQQRHPHTTGRKSHARLKKKMEDKKKGHVHKIDLWDESHKKKDGNYTNENVQQLMDKAQNELANHRRKKKGNLSSRDFDKVFADVIAKESTVDGYYDEKYWGNARFHRGSTSVEQSASEARVQEKLQAVSTQMNNVTEVTERMQAFIAQKYPEQDWINTMVVAQNEVNSSDRAGNGAIPYKG